MNETLRGRLALAISLAALVMTGNLRGQETTGPDSAPAAEPTTQAATQPATDQAAAEKASTIENFWKDLLHYIKIARAELALSNGQALLESGAEPRDIYRLSVETAGWQTVLARGANLPGMKPIIESIN